MSLIHSVDSERLLAAINESSPDAGDSGPPVSVLLEVNTSGEAAKHGLAPDDVEPLLAAAEHYPHVAIRGSDDDGGAGRWRQPSPPEISPRCANCATD